MADLYRAGEVVGQKYEIRAVLGRGGFGVVYLARSRETGNLYALKTFLDEYLADAHTRDMFQREAQVWIDLDRHPYLVRAYFVDEIGGRLHIATEYVAPDADGINTLEARLRRRPPELADTLRWGVQFCHGMEYAYSRGLASHRDIKPANILLTRDGLVKISDFGLASVFGQQGADEGGGMGTVTHMPPEQFVDARRCDARSDVYAFGVTLYQMATQGRLPFLAELPREDTPAERRRFFQAMRALHASAVPKPLNSPLWPLIARCLEKEPGRRWPSFRDLRGELDRLLERLVGERIPAPEPKDLEAWELSNKGMSWAELGRLTDALACYDAALALAPNQFQTWNNRGNALRELGRPEEALASLDQAIALAPHYPLSWSNKGLTLGVLGRHAEALAAHDKAVELARRDALCWNNRGVCLEEMGRLEESQRCFDAAIQGDPRNARAWFNKGNSLVRLDKHAEALPILAKALAVDPMFAEAWEVQGVCLAATGRGDEGVASIDKALELRPTMATAWANKANVLNDLRRGEDGLAAAERALALEPTHAPAWNNKGRGFALQGRFDEALPAFERAVALWPEFAMAWNNKGATLAKLGRPADALACFERALAIDPNLALARDNRDGVARGLAGERARAAGETDADTLCQQAAELLERDPAAALRSYESALAVDGEHALAWLGTTMALGHLGRVREAAAAVDRFLAVAPPRMAGEIATARTLRTHLARDGVIVAGRVTTRDDGTVREAVAAGERAREAQAAGRTAEAMEACERALALNPDHAHAWSLKGYLLDELDRSEEALGCFDRAAALDPTFAEPWLNKGAALMKLRRSADAERCVDEALARDPERPEAWLNKARSLQARGDITEALAAFGKATALSPELAPAWAGQATCAIKAGRPADALPAIAQAGKGDPFGAIAYAHEWLAAAAALDLAAHAREIVRVMDAILEVAGNMMTPDAWYLRGLALAALGERAGARESLEEFVAAAPEAADKVARARALLGELDAPPTPAEQAAALVKKGQAALVARRYQDALAQFEGALAFDPSAGAALAGKAAALVRLNRFTGNEPGMDRLDATEILAVRKLLEQAPPPAAPAPAAAPAGPSQVDALLEQGAAHGAQARFDEALRCFDAAVRLDAKDPRAWLGKGLMEVKLGRRDDAMRALKQAMAVAPAGAAVVNQTRDVLRELERDGKPASDAEIAQWRQRAVILRNQKQWDAALPLGERVLAERPADDETWALKADCLRGLGREAEALPALDKVTELKPNLLRAWLERGGCLLALTRAADALACADRALELDPRSAAAMILKGKCLAALGRAEEALKWLDRVLAREPNQALARFEKARVEDALGRAAEAARGYQAFLNGATPLQAAEIQQARKRLAELKSAPPR